jgi:hypothetical protein
MWLYHKEMPIREVRDLEQALQILQVLLRHDPGGGWHLRDALPRPGDTPGVCLGCYGQAVSR